MLDRTALLLLAMAAGFLVPAATAFPVDTQTSPPALAQDAAALPVVPDRPTDLVVPLAVEQVNSVMALVDETVPSGGDGPITVNAGASANVEVNGDSDADDAMGTDDVAIESVPTMSEKVATAATPAVRSALLGVLLAALAFGLESVRAGAARALGLFGRAGRAVIGTLGAVGLFSRIQREGVLDNPVRARVHDAITQEPGLSLTEVSARSGIAWGTTVHHLRRLEAHGMVVSINKLAHRRYFAANTPAAAQGASVAVVMHPTARRIARLVSQQPGIDQTGICTTLGLNNPAASKHLSHFQAQGLVLAERVGRSRHYHPTGGLHSALQMLEPTSVAITQRPAALTVQSAGAC